MKTTHPLTRRISRVAAYWHQRFAEASDQADQAHLRGDRAGFQTAFHQARDAEYRRDEARGYLALAMRGYGVHALTRRGWTQSLAATTAPRNIYVSDGRIAEAQQAALRDPRFQHMPAPIKDVQP